MGYFVFYNKSSPPWQNPGSANEEKGSLKIISLSDIEPVKIKLRKLAVTTMVRRSKRTRGENPVQEWDFPLANLATLKFCCRFFIY